MLHGHQVLQRSSFVAHEAKHFRRQGPLGRPPDTPLGVTTTTSAPQNTPAPTTTAVATTDASVRRTTVTTVVAAPTTTSTSTTSTSSSTSTSITTTSSSSTSLTTSSTSTTSLTTKSSSSTLPLSTGGKTNTIFQTTFASSSALPTTTVDSASSSSTSDSSSSVSTAGIIGISAAAIVGLAVVTGLIMFFVRRFRKGDEYDVDNLRRQSVVLGDESGSLHRGNSDGYNARPRPPTMIERHYANIAPQVPGHAPSFGGIRPGEVMPSSGLAPSVPPGSLFQQPYYGNTMGQTPLGSPVSIGPYGSAYDSQGRLVRSPSSSAASALSRGKSIRDPFNDAQQPPPEEGDYTDLSRASVTPFQAAQYAAISRELNIPPPVPTIPASADLNKSGFSAPASPFDDPKGQVAEEQPVKQAVDDVAMPPARASSEFQHHTFGHYLDDSRVASLPPMLSPQQSANMLSPQEEMNFPVSPSPLRSEFNISSTNVSALPSPVITAFAGQGPSVNSGSPLRYAVGEADDDSSHNVPPKQPSKRPQSSYEDEDAYGGF
ncbi:hypothetical protein SCHPADRAFT_941999 [Schizopora paradoxa]|uniref:Uncharacterized protein n=1 Tax=Schizopora paradoxa TaxID=27342 RepID=A0A0H2RHV1_9AGAM|nr:hypothetical protein SCHPADRAFT_941999 [Schizopora paradoxa]